ncbi:PotD/PotF family extracellular solute-binding protein [Tropicimonas sp. IMCC34043]|uniref:ABC transporter substrate-binding protein n=1 Tax=Tropicimonas sp. IMCC34043 TaxID=2248760 RepID=UPI000E289082|nr:extracellular solute-binding protein [Tropicimonas sp. IMCC34043]
MTRHLLLTSLLALAAGSATADEIRVLNWQGYGTDLDWAVEAYAAATGNTVLHEYFTSEQEMLTKLRTNPGAYDVVLINAAFTRQAKDEGLIGPIDTTSMTNFENISNGFTTDSELVIEDAVYGVPWTWGLTSFAINTNAFETAPDTIQVFWDPAHKGRVSIRDDALEAVQFGALATGQNINDVKDLDSVEKKLNELMPQIRTFWSSENDWNQYMAADELDLATYWSGSAARSADMGLPVAFVVPKEGAVAWLDGLSIPASSTHKDAATQFIDWMIDPDFYTRWDAEGAPASANAAAAEALADTSFNKRVLGDPDVVARVQFQKPVDDATRETYLELWQGLKARQ